MIILVSCKAEGSIKSSEECRVSKIFNFLFTKDDGELKAIFGPMSGQYL